MPTNHPLAPIFDRKARYGQVAHGAMIGTPPAAPEPTSLAMVESFHVGTTLNSAWGVAMSGTVACVTANNRLVTIDASDPANLSLLSSIQQPTNLSDVRDVAIYAPSNSYAVCCANGSGRVTLINVTNPSSLSLTGSLLIASAQPLGVAIKGNHAIVTDQGNDAIQSVDLSTPGTPTLADTLTDATIANPSGISIVGNVAAVSMEDSTQTRVVFIDVTDPTSMSVLGSVSDADLGLGFAVQVDADTAIAVAYGDLVSTGSLTSIDFATPATPSIQDQIVGSPFAGPVGLALYGHPSGLWAVVADQGNDSLHLVDCRDPTGLLVVDTEIVTANTWRHNPAITGDHVIAISASGDAVRVAEIVST